MGGYLDTPKTEKESEDFSNDQYNYGVSSMQGWRISQEDGHNCCPEFDPATNTSLFAVYDGHGGSEVAEYCSLHLPDFIKGLELYKKGNLAQALEDSFLAFDETILKDEVIAELKHLRGDESDVEEEYDSEIEKLEEEKDMPLEELMLRYGKAVKKNGADYQPSPALKPKKPSQNCTEGDCDDIKTNLSVELKNGHSKDKDEAETACKDKSSMDDTDCEKNNADDIKKNDAATDSELNSSSNNNKESGTAGSCISEQSGTKEGCKVNGHGDAPGAPTKEDEGGVATGSKSGTSCCHHDDVDDEVEDDDDEDSEDSEESEESEDDEDEEDDEGEDEEVDGDEEEEEGQVVWNAFGDEDKPGADSGCTAVVALLRGRELYVANAGDSRCIVCRDGKSLDMSFDHKPEDEPERKRIENAGGEVTSDGRVNNGLNLSRAIGDHCYKRNDKLPLKDQMITALPDIKSVTLDDTDEFMVLACDGIWNYMTSQEVVDYVKERIGKCEKMSNICEELFDHCLAPDKCGDGTGCDNMTCIIVKFDKLKPTSSCKRAAEDNDVMKQTAKKVKEDC